MEIALLGVVGVITIVAAGIFSKKLGVAAPLILIVIGIVASYFYGDEFTVPHELILAGLLPPILYAAAINVPVVDFRRNFSSISALSVVLVLVTAFGTGYILYLIFPDLTFAGGVAIGAIISPTDAVAATALGKKLGLPPRLVLIMEGESLVNDATALVLLRSAVAAAAATTALNFWDIALDFVYAVVFAIIIGFIVGWVTVWVRSKLRDPMLDTVISLAVPFIAFIPAEHFHASGVLAVVVAGLYSGHQSARHFSAQARISERLNWRTAQFVIENGVFLLMGFQIKTLIEDVNTGLATSDAIKLGLLFTVILVVLRYLFIGPLLLLLRRQQMHAEESQSRVAATLDRIRAMAHLSDRSTRRAERAQRIFDRRRVDLQQLKAEGLGWRGGVILGWSGMRGVVTLAAAQSLPEDPEIIPYRSQLVLLAFVVAVTTLLVQGGTLPFLIRWTGIRGTDRVADRRELAGLLEELGEAGVAALENPEFTLLDGAEIDPSVIERVRNDTLLSAESAWERADNGTDEKGIAESPHQQYRALRREVLQAERAALLEARSSGTYPSRILTRAQAMLDLEETRLEQIDNPSGS
jgi:CPA1 family monovalent cation:H+ antiporter